MAKEKEKQGLFKTTQFDDAAYAKLKRVNLGLIISAVATVFSIIAFSTINNQKLSGLCSFSFIVCIVGAIASYIIGGGFGNAVSLAFRISKWGWFLIPIFPVDIIFFFIALEFAILAFFFLPVFFVWMNQLQIKKDKAAAEEYLKYCRPIEGPAAAGSDQAFCTNCGAPISSGMAFCTKCGTKVE